MGFLCSVRIAGVRMNIALSDNLVLSPYINLGKTLKGHAKSKEYTHDGSGYQYIGRANIKLESKTLRELGLEANYRLEHELFLTGTLRHTHFDYGTSSDCVAGVRQVYEPNSRTNELQFSLGIRYGFQ